VGTFVEGVQNARLGLLNRAFDLVRGEFKRDLVQILVFLQLHFDWGVQFVQERCLDNLALILAPLCPGVIFLRDLVRDLLNLDVASQNSSGTIALSNLLLDIFVNLGRSADHLEDEIELDLNVVNACDSILDAKCRANDESALDFAF